jgi:Flp pilus assembly protein TadB
MIVLALAAAFGVFLTVEALGPRRMRVRLIEEDRRPFAQRVVDTFFAPAAARVMSVGRVDVAEQRDSLERRLARAGHPEPFTTPEAVMGYRLFTGVLFAVFGGVFVLIVGLGTLALPLMLGLFAFGWAVPDRTIANTEKERSEQLTLDAASSLDRLAIYVAAGNALHAAVRTLAEKPGGAWVAEFRKVASDYAVEGDFPSALNGVVAASGRLPDIARVAERLRAAYEMGGGGIATSLRRMAEDARTNIRLLITERGYKNAVMMVIPAFFAIVAIAIVLIAPGAVQMMSVLGGP